MSKYRKGVLRELCWDRSPVFFEAREGSASRGLQGMRRRWPPSSRRSWGPRHSRLGHQKIGYSALLSRYACCSPSYVHLSFNALPLKLTQTGCKTLLWWDTFWVFCKNCTDCILIMVSCIPRVKGCIHLHAAWWMEGDPVGLGSQADSPRPQIPVCDLRQGSPWTLLSAVHFRS